MTPSERQEILDRTERRIEAEVRAMTDLELEAAFGVARPFRRSIILEEHRRREARPELRRPPVKSCWQWLRSPAL